MDICSFNFFIFIFKTDPNFIKKCNINKQTKYQSMKARIFITVLILSVLSVLTNAQDKTGTKVEQTPVPESKGVYVDANNNGICDHYDNPGAYYGYGRGRGAGHLRGNGLGRGMGCALQPSQGRGLGPAKGCGRGLGPGRGQGLAPGGRYFIDADKNGVCDTFEQSVKNR
jgi:hypothetical protein